MATVIVGYHYRRQPNSLATLDKIDQVSVDEIFRNRFKNTGDFRFVFVGNFDVDSQKILTEKYLGPLPSTSARELPRDLSIRIPKGKIRKHLHIGQCEKGIVQMVVSKDYSHNRDNNIFIYNKIGYKLMIVREIEKTGKRSIFSIG